MKKKTVPSALEDSSQAHTALDEIKVVESRKLNLYVTSAVSYTSTGNGQSYQDISPDGVARITME